MTYVEDIIEDSAFNFGLNPLSMSNLLRCNISALRYKDDRLAKRYWQEELGKKKQVSTERSRSDSDPHRSFDSPFLMSPSFLRGPQIVRYRLCNSQWRVIDGNWKRRRAANGKGNFLPGQVNFKDTTRSVTPTTRDSTSRWLLCCTSGRNRQIETRRELIRSTLDTSFEVLYSYETIVRTAIIQT